MVIKLFVVNSELDLFKDENISIKSAITDASDISKNVGDYSKTFTVPASSNNNNIFKHYYDSDIDNTFDARIKVNCRIELDGLPFKTGKLRLSKVSMNHNEPISYTITFFGNLVSLKDKFKKSELKDLNLTAFNHSYDSDNVKQGLQTSLFRGAIVYNLLPKKQYYYNSDSSDNGDTELIANIAYNGNSAGLRWNDLRPAISLISLIEAIETDYDITFSRDFFGREEFQKLYLWLNRDKDSKVGGGNQIIDWTSNVNTLGSLTFINLTTNIGTFTNCTSCDGSYFWIYTTITPSAGYQNVAYDLITFRNDEEWAMQSFTGTGIYNFSLFYEYLTTSEIYFKIKCDQEFKYTATVRQDSWIGLTKTTEVLTSATENTINNTFQAGLQTPKITLVNFLKGIFSMFKLVVIPINENEIYINTINSYYAQGNLIDVSRYIDYNSHDVERGDIFNEIKFKFSEPQTILNKKFEENTGIAFGDEELQLADEDGEPLDGDTFNVELNFEQVIYERLKDIDDDEQTNIMYGAIINEDAEPTNIKPHIFYNVNQSIGTKTLGFKNDVAGIEELTGKINTASHTIDFFDKLYSTVFSSEFNEWDGGIINNTLYRNYYEDYVLSVFNIKMRNFKYKAILPLHILTTLQLNDILKIKERYYRIDNYNLNLLTGESDLELINYFDNTIDATGLINTIFFIDSNEQKVSSYYSGTETIEALNKENTGDGFDWYSVTLEGKNIVINVDEFGGSDNLRSSRIEVKLTNSLFINIYQIR